MRRIGVGLFVAVCSIASPAIAQEPSGPARVGDIQSFAVVPNPADVLWTEAGGLWTETVQIDAASFLKPHLSDVELGRGDSLVVRSATGHVVETITGRGPRGDGAFWGLSAFGDTLVFELYVSNDFHTPPFIVDQLVVGNDLLYEVSGRNPESICGPPDFEDVICYQGDAAKWANVMASVGVMSVGGDPSLGALWCSGSNVSADGAVLTNDHCTGTCNAEFVFKYYNQVCDGGFNPTPDWQGFRGDQVLANSPVGSCDATASTLDFTLCSILPADGNPSDTYGYVIPDPTPLADGEDLYIVQHPDGRPHEITHGGGADVFVDADRVDLNYDNTLDTEGGSSGSPVFREADDLLVGLHHCGGCPNTGMTMEAIYPLIEPFLVLDQIFSDGFESGDMSRWSATFP